MVYATLLMTEDRTTPLPSTTQSTPRSPSEADVVEEVPKPAKKKRRGPRPGSAAAKRGGQAMAETHDHDYFAAIGRKGGKAMKARGPDYFREIGRKGGLAKHHKHKHDNNPTNITAEKP